MSAGLDEHLVLRKAYTERRSELRVCCPRTRLATLVPGRFFERIHGLVKTDVVMYIILHVRFIELVKAKEKVHLVIAARQTAVYTNCTFEGNSMKVNRILFFFQSYA